MSNLASQPRLSVDLGVGKNIVTSRSVQQNPPRLQHSPSLPNIWFPPHSGPLPTQMTKISRTRLQRPSTPPPNMIKMDRVTSESSSEVVSDPVTSSKLPPNRNDKQQNSDAPHSLLTPPLTPSSSIATRSDSIGTRDNDTQATSSVEEMDGEPEATRFLLVANVAKHVQPDNLRAAISTTLRDARTKALAENVLSLKRISEDAIKGVFTRCQESHGMIMLAFHDVRLARLAKVALSAPVTGPLAECVAGGLSDGDVSTWLDCRFITAYDLAKTIGNSAFLASTDGTFYLVVEPENRNEFNNGKASHGKLHLRHLDSDGDDEGCKLNLSMLKKYLESFGDLRYFTPANDRDKDSARSFHVEYFDTREAETASAELDGQVLFGMKLKVYRPEVSATNLDPPSSSDGLPASSHSRTHHEEDCSLPSSQSGLVRFKDSRVPILPPGQHSQTRERFPFDAPSIVTVAEPDSSHNSSVIVFPSTRGHDSHSPTRFYATNHGDLYATTMRESDAHPSIDDYTPNAVDTPTLTRTDAEGVHAQTGDGSVHDFRYLYCDYQNGGYPFYYPRLDCFFSSSQREPATNLHGPATSSITPNSPGFYPPIQSNLQPGNVLYPVPHQSAPAYAFEENGRAPPVAFQNWGSDHTITIAGSAVPIRPQTVPGSVEHWYPELSLLTGCPYYPSQISGLPFYQKGSFSQQGIPAHGPPLFISNDRTPSPPCTVDCSSSAPSQVPSTRTREQPPLPERNQLNLARIEDGQDTRTTVMIKNIPNKMSDKDLLNFIHKVCPRRIDFLYLRMDFSNGCNVGYAFVNFIHVQDLLAFARQKLGEKWNMFSSEKVLQMSYANYQGKEALVEKFKNSCIMDEREAWRPKIFYSNGPEQGLPEPFPSPTHLRRKERSSHNRGALYVPGVGSGLQTQLYANVGPRRHTQQSDDHRVRTAEKDMAKIRDADTTSPATALVKRGRMPR